MTPYLDGLKAVLKEGLLIVEGAVTQPIGLTYDLRALRESLFPEKTPQDEAGGEPRRSRVSVEQGLAALPLVEGSIIQLRSLDAIDAKLVGRAQMVMSRVGARLGAHLREGLAKKLRGLYVIVDPEVTRRDVVEVAEGALRGGARVIQWRDKGRDKGDQLPLCQRLAELCAGHDALLIVNDHADLATASGAHGLHLGQHDLPLALARQLLKPQQLIGTSNALLEEAQASEDGGADYIAVGSIFPTGTKSNTRPAGLETLRRVREAVQAPIVAIGGINDGNVEEVIAAGADAVAVISAVTGAPDPEAAARRLTERIQGALARRGAT